MDLRELSGEVAAIAAEHVSSGAVRIDDGLGGSFADAWGHADRTNHVANTPTTVFAVASITKGFTALVVMRLVELGSLSLATRARTLLGQDLPLIADDVTIEQLLAHRSGIGDYLDEDLLDGKDAYVLTVPTHTLGTVADHLRVLDGHPMVAEAGAEFRYNNGAFVVLALLAERAAGRWLPELVDDLVCRPAGLANTSFLRSDEAHPGVARHYLADDGLRTNVLHMPLVGAGDGGVHTTVNDLHTLWGALDAGRIVSAATWDDMRRSRTVVGADRHGYGLGCWLAEPDIVFLEGADAGISARSMHQPSTGITATVLSNTTDGAWPIARVLLRALSDTL